MSVTLTNSQIGVSSVGGSRSGIAIELGSAQVPSAGGTNEMSYVVVIRLTLDDAVKRIAGVRRIMARLTIGDQIRDDLTKSDRVRLDAGDASHLERGSELQLEVDLLHLAFRSKDGKDLSRLLPEIHFYVIQTEHVELDPRERKDVSSDSFLDQTALVDTCC